jgi:zinc protease
MSTTDSMPLDRTKPPLPGAPKDVSFPDYFEAALSNGLKVIVYERSDLPIVAVHVVARSGSFHDGGLPGIATMMAEVQTKGTASRSAIDVVEQIEFLGGSIHAYAGWDSSSAGISILSKHVDHAMEVLADVVRYPSFPDEELERVREQRLAHILQRKSSPNGLAASRFARAVYGTHPYAFPPDGTESVIASIQRAALEEFHRSAYTPANVFLIAVGDISPDRMMPIAERLFGDWDARTEPLPDRLPPVPMPRTLVHVVDRPSAVQSSLLVGHPGIERSNPDYILVSFMNVLFGGYFGSRLNLNLREDKGFTYGAHSRFEARRQAGPFSAGADVRNEVTDRAIDEILSEIRRLTNEPVPAEELQNVKNYVTGNFPVQIETPSQVAQRILTIELYRLGKTYYNSYNSRVLAITEDDVLRAAQTYLQPDRLAIVAAGKGVLLRDTLARFGPVQVFDADDNELENPSSITEP